METKPTTMQDVDKLVEKIAEKLDQHEQKQVAKPDFGNGRYSTAMKELYQDSQRLLGLSEEHAAKVAKGFGSDLGRYSPRIEFKYGKVNKDGKLTLREASKIKDLPLTYPISLARAVQLLQESTGFGINTFNGVTLDSQFVEWLKK